MDDLKEISIIDLLKSYLICKQFIRSQEYAREYFDPNGTHTILSRAEYETRMTVVEGLLKSIEPSSEYTLLCLHYLKGVPIEKMC